MKSICILLMGLATVALLVVGCDQQAPTDRLKDQPEISQVDLSARPDIGPGKSNWTPPSKKSSSILSPGITTTDLNTLTPSDLVSTLIGTGPNAPVISNITFSGAKGL